MRDKKTALRPWLQTAGLVALLAASGHLPAKGQTSVGKVVFVKENRLYIDWNKSSSIKKGNTLFIVAENDTLGNATVAWAQDDLIMVEMATGFSRLAEFPKEKLVVVTEAAKPTGRTGSLTIAISGALETNWGRKTLSPDRLSFLSCLYEGLIAETPEGRLIPALSDSFKTSERSVTFYIKSRLSFTSGKRLTAFEVKNAFESQLRSPAAFRWANLLAPKGALPRRFPPLTSPIEVSDTATLIFHLKGFAPLFLSYLASPFGWIKDISDTLSRFPAGAGPFRIDALRSNSIRLVRNRNYRGSTPECDTLNFRWFAQREDAETAFLRGAVSLAWFSAGELSQALRSDPSLGEKELCHIPEPRTVAAFFTRAVTPDSSRMLSAGAALAAEEIGPELFRGDWIVQTPVSARPDSFKIRFQVEPELDSTGLISAFLSSSRSDLQDFEMILAQVETYFPSREAKVLSVLSELKSYTGSRPIDSLLSVLNQSAFARLKEKETVLSKIEQFLVDRFALTYLYRPSMVLLVNPELSGFRCGRTPYYPTISKKERREPAPNPPQPVTEKP
jgi:hypothetical protein